MPMKPYDYNALHLQLLKEWSRTYKASDDDCIMASGLLTDAEFEVWKFCQSGSVPPKAWQVAEHLVDVGISRKLSEPVVRQLFFKIRKKGFVVRTAPPAGGHKPFERDLNVVSALARGLGYREISEEMRLDTFTIKLLTMRLRKQYPQFLIQEVAKTTASSV